MDPPSNAPLFSPLQLRPVVWGMRALFAVVVGHGVFATVAFGSLPERLPVHFGANGVPDAFARPGIGSWFFLVLVSAVFALVVAGVALAIFRFPPKWINVPKKAAFLELPERDRQAVLGTIAAFLLLIAVTIAAGLLAIHALQALVALDRISAFPVAAPFVVTGAIFAETIAMFIRTSSAVEKATAQRVHQRR